MFDRTAIILALTAILTCPSTSVYLEKRSKITVDLVNDAFNFTTFNGSDLSLNINDSDESNIVNDAICPVVSQTQLTVMRALTQLATLQLHA